MAVAFIQSHAAWEPHGIHPAEPPRFHLASTEISLSKHGCRLRAMGASTDVKDQHAMICIVRHKQASSVAGDAARQKQPMGIGGQCSWCFLFDVDGLTFGVEAPRIEVALAVDADRPLRCSHVELKDRLLN